MGVKGRKCFKKEKEFHSVSCHSEIWYSEDGKLTIGFNITGDEEKCGFNGREGTVAWL